MAALFFTQGTTSTALLYLLAAVADSWLLIWSDHLNQPSLLQGALCFLAAILFALAAYLVPRRPHIAHACAVAGSLALPWMYTTTLHGNIFVNEWIIFNVPDRDVLSYHAVARPELAVVAVALIVGAIGTGALRLLPGHWMFRGMPVRDRTWPAGAATFCFLAVWFSQSVSPYRIPGAVTYSSWPMLQILHVEKQGLQFHEVSYRVWRRGGLPLSVDVSSNDRRLFEYRFQQRFAHLGVSASVEEQITAMVQSLETVKPDRGAIKPLRRWNDEGWYVASPALWVRFHRTTPPPEVLELFNELDNTPRGGETSEDRKDVCLGFCYDPLSGLGALYANHRCHWEQRGVDCR